MHGAWRNSGMILQHSYMYSTLNEVFLALNWTYSNTHSGASALKTLPLFYLKTVQIESVRQFSYNLTVRLKSTSQIQQILKG